MFMNAVVARYLNSDCRFRIVALRSLIPQRVYHVRRAVIIFRESQRGPNPARLFNRTKQV